MSARIPTRRIGQTALSITARPTASRTPCAAIYPLTAMRSLSLKDLKLFKSKSSENTEKDLDLSNPLLQKFLEARSQAKGEGQEAAMRPDVKFGNLAKTTLFDRKIETPGYRADMTPEQLEAAEAAKEARLAKMAARKNATLSSAKLDPEPRTRLLWERKMVIRGIQKRGRMTKDEKLARTERESLFKSQNLPTSVKKMTRLMHQIKGKTLEEALIQMRFSKKRVARDVIKGLQLARDEAITKRGMSSGLRKTAAIVSPESAKDDSATTAVKKESETAVAKQDNVTEEAAAKVEASRAAKAEASRAAKAEATRLAEQERLLSAGTFRRPKDGKGTTIELKDGSKKQVHDPTEMYIDQAWCGKGFMWKSPEFRARGRINMLRHRTTSFSIVLKEEKTRMRLSQEIAKKRDNRKLWVALPDRPITRQRQFCLW